MKKLYSRVCLLMGMMLIVGSAGGAANTTAKEQEYFTIDTRTIDRMLSYTPTDVLEGFYDVFMECAPYITEISVTDNIYTYGEINCTIDGLSKNELKDRVEQNLGFSLRKDDWGNYYRAMEEDTYDLNKVCIEEFNEQVFLTMQSADFSMVEAFQTPDDYLRLLGENALDYTPENAILGSQCVEFNFNDNTFVLTNVYFLPIQGRQKIADDYINGFCQMEGYFDLYNEEFDMHFHSLNPSDGIIITTEYIEEEYGQAQIKTSLWYTEPMPPTVSEIPDENQIQTGAETPSILPVAILNEKYNLFYDVEFPESYSIYAAAYEEDKGEYCYYLYLVTTDSADEVVPFMSHLLGDSAEGSIKQNLEYLQNDGFVGIDGTQADTGLNAACEIKPTEEDVDYAYEEGYVISLGMGVAPEDAGKYNDFLLSNLSYTSLTQVAAYMDITAYEMAEITVNVLQNNVQMHFGYYMSNAKQVWNDMASDLADNYTEEFSRFDFSYGELSTVIHEDLNRGYIHVFQSCNTAETSIGEYTAKKSLKNFGFKDYRGESAKCSYGDNDYWLSISKPEWGVNAHESEKNAITFYKNFNGNSLFVFYHPETNLYLILIDYEGSQIEYEYNIADNSYTGGDDLTAAKKIAEQLFEKPDTDNILQDAWVTFEQYIDETFGMNVNELFALRYE